MRGGMTDLRKIATLADTFGVTIAPHLFPELNVHLLASIPNVLAVAYGIQTVPHLFLVGKDGKIATRNAQAGPGLAAEVEKLVK